MSIGRHAARPSGGLPRRGHYNRRTLNFCYGSIATGRGKPQVQQCPQCPVSDGRPEKTGLS
jgi:hypothetical protein